MGEDFKRLFFAMEVNAPWPDDFPSGRLLDTTHRHLTLAFLGHTNFSKLLESLPNFPTPLFKLGFAAQFDQCLFFPPRHSRVAAWKIQWDEHDQALIQPFYNNLIDWLHRSGFTVRIHPQFIPHVTLARSPFNPHAWKKAFSPLPLKIGGIHLFESVGNLHYQSIWHYPLLSPFEEIEHVADLAFWIRGTNFDQLYRHGAMALCYTFPPFLPFIQQQKNLNALEEVVMALNALIAHADQEIGSPFKAVSFHDHLIDKENLLHWEMIVDV